jgi:uncharacterized membrane protein
LKRPRITYFLSLVITLTVFLAFGSYGVVLAQEEVTEEAPAPEEIELSTTYPALRGPFGTTFEFRVEVSYRGREERTFDLLAKVPEGWHAFIRPAHEDTAISAVRMQPFAPERLRITFIPLKKMLPGEYVATLEVSSGELKESIDLKAEITAIYKLALGTATGRLNTSVTAGEDNHFSLVLDNQGSDAIENISFSSDEPEGWRITFNPDKVESLEAGKTQEVDMTIIPPAKTIAGDYAMTVHATSDHASDDLELRITVLTPDLWGWVGVGIVLLVVAGLAVVFVQLGRR